MVSPHIKIQRIKNYFYRTSTPSNKEVPNFPQISETQYYPSINEKNCGSFRTLLISGGHPAPRGSFPFMVAFTQASTIFQMIL